MYVIDLEGNEYPIQVTSTNENETNGNQSLSATILATKVNQAFISDIAEMWRIVDHDNVEHKIIYAKRKGIGTYRREYDYIQSDDTYFLSPNQPVKKTEKKLKQSTNLSVEIKAIPLFFDEFDNDRIYERYDKHMTALEAFQRIFQGTNFDFSLGDQFDAVQWEGFGAGESRLETFKRALERYKCEFRISGNMIFLERRIGRDTQFQYRHRLNASNIEQEIDANEMWTFARGYGDYGGSGESTEDDKEDWEHAKLEREYTSPLAKVIGIRHAPPLKNGNITTKSKMDRELKALVDESLKISVSADIYDLQKQGYPVAQSEVGDRVFLIDERIGLDDEVRVVSQSKTRNWKGDVIDLNITFGSEKIAKRHQTNLTTAAKEINDLIAGRKKLPYSVLPAAEQAALKALNEARTELIFGNAENGVQGIIAKDKDDPNRMMWINSAGWMISTDGGATSHVAATADGIVADVIFAGTLNADQVAIRGGDGNSYTYIQGAMIELKGNFNRTWRDITENHDIRTRMQYGHLRFRNDTEDRSIYVSDFGMSTAIDGSLDENSSGTLQFFDTQFDELRGVTLHSYYGVPALQSDRNRVVIAPMERSRSGTNHFSFRVKDNESYKDTDGWISFGDINTNTHHSGIRFSKDSGVYTIYATNGEGDIGTGNFHAEGFYGELRPRGNYNYIRSERTRFVAPGNSDTTYSTIQFKDGMSESIRTVSTNFYIGTSSGEVRVTNNLLYNDGDIGYRPIKASNFKEASSKDYKKNIKKLYCNASDIVKKLNVMEYDLKGESESPFKDAAVKKRVGFIAEENPEISEDNTSTDLGKVIGINTKSLQEVIERVEKLEAKL